MPKSKTLLGILLTAGAVITTGCITQSDNSSDPDAGESSKTASVDSSETDSPPSLAQEGAVQVGFGETVEIAVPADAVIAIQVSGASRDEALAKPVDCEVREASGALIPLLPPPTDDSSESRDGSTLWFNKFILSAPPSPPPVTVTCTTTDEGLDFVRLVPQGITP